MYVCPHCQKQVKDLKGHIARAHPDKVRGEKPAVQNEPKGKVLELVLEAKAEKSKEPGSEPVAALYHCVDCGAGLTKGQNPCPSCGAHLDWSQL